mmetsp:Transcript_7729/g.14337  ORF Transcript_7729/g.14337 Transcript_7729/m.14337 type:complete len:146 (-) Transcript_7729:911-1348(-)
MRRRMARKRQQTAISGRDSDDPARPERAPNRRRSPWDEDWDLKIDDSDCYECDADNHLQVPAPSIESRAILMVLSVCILSLHSPHFRFPPLFTSPHQRGVFSPTRHGNRSRQKQRPDELTGESYTELQKAHMIQRKRPKISERVE